MTSTIQLSRDSTGHLPCLTKWSRHEPAALKRMDKGHTDHWSKTKHKTVTLFTSGKDSKTHFFPGERFPHEEVPTPASKSITPHYIINGCMKHIGTRSFTDMLSEINYPGDYYRLTSKNPSTRLLRTCANQRARENFVYWQTEPKPTKHGLKKWIGNGGSIIGTSHK